MAVDVRSIMDYAKRLELAEGRLRTVMAVLRVALTEGLTPTDVARLLSSIEEPREDQTADVRGGA